MKTMKKNMNNTFQKNILRISLGLIMLSGTSAVMAQEETGAAPETRKPVKEQPQYEMKEVSGYVYDAATKAPMDGARVQAYGNNRYSIMTDENGKFTIKVPVFINSLYVTVPEYNDVRVAIDGDKNED